jgi:pimeloyl-ACP methyl ester carboxylesterase
MDAHFARELREVLWAGLLSPWGWTAPGNRALLWLLDPRQEPADTLHRTPVVLVHGFGGNRSNWLPLELALSRAGFLNVHTAAYHSMTASLGGIARALRTTCHDAMEAAGTDHLHLVGHSLGGVAVRYAVQRLGLAADVRTAVTVAAPHRGTPVASLGWGPVARALRPGSPILQDLDRGVGADGVRWVTYYSDRDVIVPPDSARLDDPKVHALNVPVPDAGHLGILRAPVFLRSVQRILLAAEKPPEERAGAVAPTPPQAAAAA